MTTQSVFAVLMSTLLLSGPGGVARASDRPSDIQRQIAKTERQYFALYNRLNNDPRYDIVCRGRLDDGRTCWPRYLEAEWQLRRKCDNWCFIYQDPAVIEARVSNDRNFRIRAMQVLRGSPELQALGVKLESLQVRQTPQ